MVKVLHIHIICLISRGILVYKITKVLVIRESLKIKPDGCESCPPKLYVNTIGNVNFFFNRGLKFYDCYNM